MTLDRSRANPMVLYGTGWGQAACICTAALALPTCAYAQSTGIAIREDGGPAAAGAEISLLKDQLAGLQAKSDRQQAEIAALKQEIDQLLLAVRGAGLGTGGGAGGSVGASTSAAEPQVASAQPVPSTPTPSTPAQAEATPPSTPQTVGQAPSTEGEIAQKAASVPQAQGVLTPRGHLIVEPSVEYLRAADNRLVFSGVELIPGLQLGIIKASTAMRDTVVSTGTLRYGLSSRIELEVRVPFLYRHDDISVVQQRDSQIVDNLNLTTSHLGDVEGAIRYQLNPTSDSHAIWIASLRVKSDTGIGPYDVSYDNYGIATSLATGSGFWGIQPGISFLLPSDPGIIYGSLSYLYQFPRKLNREVGGALIQNVEPGGAISGNLGFGFALNPRFSFSLGYSHAYVLPTRTLFGGNWQSSSGLQVGSFDLGASYKINERQQFNIMFQFGVTPDAPGLNVTLRYPLRF